ncbi:MAG TPA: twin transmembrane helix small protein [Gammaproteobacteria bacterium]
MLFKAFILILLLVVIFSLGSALFHLVNKKGKSDKVIKSLTWRIGLSVLIFILLLIGQATGLITPHGLP